MVTGASSGIGLELAREFADSGFDVVMVAENAELETAARKVRDETGRVVEAIQVDLASEAGVEELYTRLTQLGRPLDAIALNAGIGMGGLFATETDIDQELELIDLNVRSTVHLAKLVVRDMVERGAGRILFTGSIGATLPGSHHAVYNASKSFVQSFALAIRDELKDTGVTVTVLMPGPTDTEFFERADLEDSRIVQQGSLDDPADVARDGFQALISGDERVVSASLSTKAQARFSRVLPDSAKAAMHRKQAEPVDGDGNGSGGDAAA